MISNLGTYNGWFDENTGQLYETTVSEDRINLINKGNIQELQNPAVEVVGNISRRGGGLAANGTYILGPVGDTTSVEAGMKVAKEWASSIQPEPVMMRVTASDGTHSAVVADVPLDGIANPPINEFETIQELEPYLNEFGRMVWNGQFSLPLTLISDDDSHTKMPVYIFHLKYGSVDEDIDPQSFLGRNKLASVIKEIKAAHTQGGVVDHDAVIRDLKDAIKIRFNNDLQFTLTEYAMEEVTDPNTNKTIWVIKTDEQGNPVEIKSVIFTQKELKLDEVEFELTSEPQYERVWDEGEKKYVDKEVFQAHILGVNLTLAGSNDNKPITEKYVNDRVHADIINFDQHFKYDIMGYVPLEATAFEMMDTLYPGLEYADKDGKPVQDASTVEKITIKLINDHQPNGTVSQRGLVDRQGKEIDIKNKAEELTIDGDTLKVRFTDVETLDLLRGHWVQVTFYARILNQYRNLDALKEINPTWVDEDYNKQGDPAFDLEFANGDFQLIQSLMNRIGPEDIIWAVEGPSRLFAKSDKGDYYATPMDDKTGNVWIGPLEEGSEDWRNADNRYYGRSAEGRNTKRQLDLSDPDDKKLLEALYKMPKIKGAAVEKGAEGASRLFIQVKMPDGTTKIYATPMNDKSGNDWDEVLPGTTDYEIAVKRLIPDKFTLRMLDFETESYVLSKDSHNWPVISEERHEGLQNEAKYRVRFGNEWQDNYETNVVTVKPETTELIVEKIWNNNSVNEWPSNIKSVTFKVFAVKDDEESPVYVKDGKVVSIDTEGAEELIVVLTKNKTKETVEGLPKLIGTTYIAREILINDIEIPYDDKNHKGSVVIDGVEIFTVMSNQINDKRFRKADEQIEEELLVGVSSDNRLWVMSADGKYYATAIGDITGTKSSTKWTEIKEPASDASEEEVLLYARAQALLGSIDEEGRQYEGTAEDVNVIDLTKTFTATNKRTTTTPTPTPTTTPKIDIPYTGDSLHLNSWLFLFGLSVMMIFSSLYMVKRKHS